MGGAAGAVGVAGPDPRGAGGVQQLDVNEDASAGAVDVLEDDPARRRGFALPSMSTTAFVIVVVFVFGVDVPYPRSPLLLFQPLDRSCAPTTLRTKVPPAARPPFSSSCNQNLRVVSAGTNMCGAWARARFGTRVAERWSVSR